MKNNMENSPNEKQTFCNETLRPLSAPPIVNLLNFASTDLLYHSYYTKHSKKDVRLPLPDFFFEGQAYLSTYFYDLNECNCKICGICTINTIESVLMTKKSLVDRINEDFPSDVSPYNGESRCTTPMGQKKEPDNLLMFDILQFVSLNKAFFFKNTDNVITSESLTKEIIIMLCKDQEASRFIQKRLEYATESELDWLFDSISNHLIELSCDLFGNYVIQKYINTHGEIIYDILRNRLSILSYDIYGCRVVQKLLDSIYFNLEDEFCNSVIDLTKDQNGNHVIQKVIEAGKVVFYAEPEEVYVFNKEEVSIKLTETTNEKIELKAMSEPIAQNLVIENKFKETKSENLNSTNFQDEFEFDYSSESEITQNEEPSTQVTTPKSEFYRIKFLINDFEKHALEMCKHKYGCRAVQRLFEFCYEECDLIIQIILENLDDLIYDQYGNYVIQHLLNYENERNIILNFLCENVMKLSCHKFASNVVEKGISVSGENIYRIGDAIKDKSNIITLANSGFGNYVLQRMIESNDKRIREICKGYATELRKCTYGKQVLSKVNVCKI